MKLMKRIFCLSITLALVGVLVTSCEREIIGGEDGLVINNLTNDKIYESVEETKTSNLYLNNENLLTPDELLKSLNFEVEFPQRSQKNGASCSNLYNIYYAWYRAYVKWFYTPSAANEAAMDTAYCNYISLYNSCKGTNHSC